MEKLVSLTGLIVMYLIAYGMSTSRKDINWRTIVAGTILQFVFALLILKTPWGEQFFEGARVAFEKVLAFTHEGSNFIFGSLADSSKLGFIFFTMVLPTIIFMSALMSVLYYLGIMQFLIRLVAKVMVRLMGTSGAESLAAAANIFAGQTEAPLVVKPFISKMTESELLALMCGGMASVAGGVLAAYVGFGIDAGHLLAASVMSAPGSLVCAKLMIPETQESLTKGEVRIDLKSESVNVIDAAAKGTSDGLYLALNVGAMLLAFIALIAMLNGILGYIGSLFGFDGFSMELILGYLFAPFAFIMGVPWDEALIAGSLLGKKIVLNEFVAYLELGKIMHELSDRTVVILTYALCGFANFSSIAIQVGGIGVMAPERRPELARLGIRSLIAGTLTCFMTACIAALFV